MSDAAGLNVGAVIDERLAARFRELCRKELLGERETEELVSQAMSLPTVERPYPPGTAGPGVGRAAVQGETGTEWKRERKPESYASGGRRRCARSASANARDRLWGMLRSRLRAALRRT